VLVFTKEHYTLFAMGVKRHQFPYAEKSTKSSDGQVMANGQTVDLKFPLKNIAKLPADQLPTKKELQDSIPAHCFKHSIPRALALVLRDAVIIGCIFHLGWNYLPMEKSPLFSVAWFGETAAWHMYWFWQGTALTGWWVLAHECGHRGFSDNTYLCDAVGWVLHSFLLVPYFSWQYTHSVHHSKTNHLLDGESHVPHAIGNPAVTLPEKIEKMSLNQRFFEFIGDDAFAIYQIITHCVLGWPMYLFFNVTGSKRTTEGASVTSVRDHFRPSSKLFPGHRGWDFRVLMSTVGVLMALFGLFLAGEHFATARCVGSTFHRTCGTTSGSSCTPGCNTPPMTCLTLVPTNGHGCVVAYARSTATMASSTLCITTSAPPTCVTTSSHAHHATMQWRQQQHSRLTSSPRGCITTMTPTGWSQPGRLRTSATMSKRTRASSISSL